MRKTLTFGVFILSVAIAGSFLGMASAQEGPTAPDVSTTIVISQVYGGGGANSGTPTYSKDYVELKNISSSPQSLAGLSLYYGSATGQFASSPGNAFALPDVTLQPGQYFLVATGPEGTAGAALPVPADATTTNLTMGAASGKVALVNGLPQNSCGATATPCTLPNAQIVDVVAWGTSNNAEGGTAVNGGTTLTNEQGVVRKNAGCTDTDNNNADFDVVTNPVPRNTSTAAAPCSGAPAPTSAFRLFTSHLNGASEVPSVNTTALGFGRVFLNQAEDQITVSVYYSNLSSGTTAGHIHGPAAVGANASPIFDLMPTAGQTTGSVTNMTFNVTQQQVADLRAGLWYFNIHTTNFPGGEIRGQITPPAAPSDFNGDSKTDFAIIRGDGSASGTAVWWINHNGTDEVRIESFGFNSDYFLPADYDGDGADDIAVWRSSGTAGFWVLASGDGTATFTEFGQQGDEPNVVADYTGDGKDDFAIYRRGATAEAPSEFWYLARSGIYSGFQVVVKWGLPTDSPMIGDYDGNGLADFTVIRPTGSSNTSPNVVYTLANMPDGSIGEVSIRQFGIFVDFFVPGDYDGDGITDLAVSRAVGSLKRWIYRPSSGGDDVWIQWGREGGTPDVEAPGDYDGDGRTDIAVWRPGSINTPGSSTFIVMLSSGGVLYRPWGIASDVVTFWEVVQ